MLNRFVFLLTTFILTAQADVVTPHSIVQKIEGTIESPYTAKIIELIQGWGDIELPPAQESGESFWIQGIRTRGNPDYIGLRKRIFIHAQPAQVLSILEDFQSYPNVFPGVQEVQVLSQDVNETTTSWIRDRPLFSFRR